MHAAIVMGFAALRARRMLVCFLVIVAAARAALMPVRLHFLLGRRQRHTGFQRGVAGDLTLRMRHHRINHFGALALALFLLLPAAVVAARPAIATTAAAIAPTLAPGRQRSA